MVLLVLRLVLLRMLLMGVLRVLLLMRLVLLLMMRLLVLVSLMLRVLGMRLVMLLRVLLMLLSSGVRGLSRIAGELIPTSHVWLIGVRGAGLKGNVSMPSRQFGVA